MFLLVTFKYILSLFILLMIFRFMTLLPCQVHKVQLTLITLVFPLFVVLVFMKYNFLFTTKLVLVNNKRCILEFNLSDFSDERS